jgi:hypothetical protein
MFNIFLFQRHFWEQWQSRHLKQCTKIQITHKNTNKTFYIIQAKLDVLSDAQ